MHAPAGPHAPNPPEVEDGDNTLPVLRVGIGITVVGFVAVGFETGTFAWIGLLWALSLYAVGVFVGFLFSVSRVVENAAAVSSATTSSLRYLPNTGLEQIADWLTKIIVGLTLVELQKIPPKILSLSIIIAASLGNSAGAKGLAYAMIIFFPIVGFLGMYLSTRLYLNQGIRKAEERAQQFANVTGDAVDNPEPSLEDPNRGNTGAVKSIASDIAIVPLDKLSNPSDIAAWARAQSVLGGWRGAIQGFRKAVALNPTDPKLRLDYAVALFNSGAPLDQVVEQIEAGINLVDPSKDPRLASLLQENLLMACLYMPAPKGFTKGIEVAENLINSLLPKRAQAYFYAACAYGQKYADLQKSANADPGLVAETRRKVIKYTRMAMHLDPSLRRAFRTVSDPNAPNKAKQDNDLEALFDDPEFRAIVW